MDVSAEAETPQRVLIVGGGFAGTYAAMQLRAAARAGHRITLVSDENFMQYQPFLPEVASGTIDPRAAVVPLRGLLKHAHIVKAEVTAIDHDARRVDARAVDGRMLALHYDVLVLTAGSWSRVLPVPGLAEMGVGFKTIQEAIWLRNHVLARLDAATQTDDEERRRALLTFVFVGAGYAGVEALAELEDLTRDALKVYPGIHTRDLRWVLVEAGPRILPELPPDLATYASRLLTERGIQVCVGTRLDSAEGGVMRLTDGSAFAAETLVWTTGVKPSPLAGLSGLPLDAHGRVCVSAELRVNGLDDAWAAGDLAAVPDLVMGGFCPPTAQHAMREGRRLGRNLSAVLTGEGAIEPFIWRNVGGVCSLGRFKGVADIFGVKLRGFPAWFLARAYHLYALPTIGRRVRIAMDWAVALLFPRDISQLGSFEHPREPFQRAAASKPADLGPGDPKR
jgi:NADH:ubiquinone reductase (H+-translocating)